MADHIIYYGQKKSNTTDVYIYMFWGFFERYYNTKLEMLSCLIDSSQFYFVVCSVTTSSS